MSIRAPFRFAPINRRVYFPEWGPLVSHDVPFEDGFCGEIRFSIEAVSDLLLGGPRREGKQADKKGSERVGEVWPFQLPDGTYAIAPSSLQGMVRSILEVAGFGKLKPFVDNQRFGIRDISPGETAKALYGKRITYTDSANVIRSRAHAGWLKRGDDGKPILVKCKFARIASVDILSLAHANQKRALGGVLDARNEARDRYEAFLGAGASRSGLSIKVHLSEESVEWHQRGRIKLAYERCTAGGRTDGTLVFTGKPMAGGEHESGRKHLEFVFHTPNRDGAALETKPISDTVWNDFKLIHQPEDSSGKIINPNWDYWRKDYERGERVPVFYLTKDDKIIAIGTAYMFKLAMELSTHDMLENSSADHFNPKPDIATLIFGHPADDGEAGCKRRATFDFARALAGTQTQRPARDEVVLLSPKPSYYPIYVRQPKTVNGDRLPANSTYAVYAKQDGPGAEQQSPELSGVKVWPAPQRLCNANADTRVKRPDIPKGVGAHLRSRHHILPPGTCFPDVALRVHNLRPVEIGALLWALTWGQATNEDSRLVHRIGMGKPYGMGAIRIRLSPTDVNRLLPNEEGVDTPEASWFIAKFEEAMQAFYDPDGRKQWKLSPQVATLLKSADPAQNPDNTLEYMNGHQEYRKHQAEHNQRPDEGRFVMPAYVADAGHELDRGLVTRHLSAEIAAPRKVPQALPATPQREQDPYIGAKVLSNGKEGKIIKKLPDGRYAVQLSSNNMTVNVAHDKLTFVQDQ